MTIFSPAGQKIVIVSRDNTVQVWDIRSETRSKEKINEIVKQHVPFRLSQRRLTEEAKTP